jgi:hypothetical protein
MGMNIYRVLGDICHILSIATLLWQLIMNKNAKGQYGMFCSRTMNQSVMTSVDNVKFDILLYIYI